MSFSSELNGSNSQCVEYLNMELDNDEYRTIKLPNGLTALLIHDAPNENEREHSSCESDESDEADERKDDEDRDNDEDCVNDANCNEAGNTVTCALCIEVGSFSNPPEFPGLAHLLEHVIFLGSEKYPEENGFLSFVRKHGGITNATTTNNYMTFYFDINEKHLFAALDRFANMFMKPLIRKESIVKERKAINDEFISVANSLRLKKLHLLKSFAHAGHPINKFARGNAISLCDDANDDDMLYKELHKFRERHYSANRMTLTIQSTLSLDVLEKYVTTCFMDVPNNGLPPIDFTEFKDPNSFDTPAFRKMYFLESVGVGTHVELSWAMPTQFDIKVKHKSKPQDYVTWILKHEGKGSLVSYLRKKKWAINFVFPVNKEFVDNSMFTLMNLVINLTPKGVRHVTDVLDAVFSFLNFVRREGPQKRIYDEIVWAEDAIFKFFTRRDASTYGQYLCRNMLYYPPQEYLTGSSVSGKYKPEFIQRFMDHLVPEKVNIMILTHEFYEEFDEIEPWFNTRYKGREITEESKRWTKIEPFPEFHHPLPNYFITNDFDLTFLTDGKGYITPVYCDPMCEIWYRADENYLKPICSMDFNFMSPLRFNSELPVYLVHMDMYVTALEVLLTEELYPAKVANLRYSFYVSPMGSICIGLHGFTEKLPLLSQTIAKYIRNYPKLITKDVFQVARRQLCGKYWECDYSDEFDSNINLYISKLLNCRPRGTAHTLSKMNFKDFNNFLRCFNEQLYIQCCVQGNITEETAIANAKSFVQTMNCGQSFDVKITKLAIAPIRPGVYNFKREWSREEASQVINYYQAGTYSLELFVLMDLLISLMQDPLLNKLRFEEQLAYAIVCDYEDFYDTLGFCIKVTFDSTKYSTEFMDERIEEFLKLFRKAIDKMSEENLNEIKVTLISRRQWDCSLEREFVRNWRDILRCRFVVNRMEREIQLIRSLKLAGVKNWFHTILNAEGYRKLLMEELFH